MNFEVHRTIPRLVDERSRRFLSDGVTKRLGALESEKGAPADEKDVQRGEVVAVVADATVAMFAWEELHALESHAPPRAVTVARAESGVQRVRGSRWRGSHGGDVGDVDELAAGDAVRHEPETVPEVWTSSSCRMQDAVQVDCL